MINKHDNKLAIFNSGVDSTVHSIPVPAGTCDVGFAIVDKVEAVKYVSTIVLDDLLKPFMDGTNPMYAKIDTEGAEVLILRSMKQLLANRVIKGASIEWAPMRWSKFGISKDEGIKLVCSLLKTYDIHVMHTLIIKQLPESIRAKEYVYPLTKGATTPDMLAYKLDETNCKDIGNIDTSLMIDVKET
jgi:hypothetical protein